MNSVTGAEFCLTDLKFECFKAHKLEILPDRVPGSAFSGQKILHIGAAFKVANA